MIDYGGIIPGLALGHILFAAILLIGGYAVTKGEQE